VTIRDGHGVDPESGYVFQTRIWIFGKNGIRYAWYDVYRMCVKAWQRWAQSRIGVLKFGG